ncbi:MAG: hypothetical protein HOD63_06895 [Bacteroidetes bacterium]|jgi:TonB family protein|nr:hypothetical protein [Bacteroidota bacterium]MBT5527815.1 hypothetical protein [Cytophagia bacterium]MBT3802629.1 hypothetical protein [Bacteroidota bacterium]MBT3935031.1 hypothetical protein [Bacteroidota bacterium]MBT4338298.1 hypothetical protein [Bacteroidota bacterium]
MNFFFIILTLQISFLSFGQIDKTNTRFEISFIDTSLGSFYSSSATPPEFYGGVDSLFAFAQRTIYYPELGIRDSITGRLVLYFEIDSSGHVMNDSIKESLREDFDQICLDMMKQMPRWKPATISGKPEAVCVLWPIRFTLSTKNEELD